jgi:hypothetical protein
MTRRRRPMLTVLTRPVLISPHMVVLPMPRSLQASLTVTASGFAPSKRSREMAVLRILPRNSIPKPLRRPPARSLKKSATRRTAFTCLLQMCGRCMQAPHAPMCPAGDSDAHEPDQYVPPPRSVSARRKRDDVIGRKLTETGSVKIS